MSKIEELKAYVPIMGMIECEDSCGTYLEKDDVVALISNLEKQLAETQTEAAKGKAAMEFAEKCVAEFQDGIDDTNKEYFYQFMREYIDIIIDGVCKQSCKKYEVEKGKAAIKAMEKISILTGNGEEIKVALPQR
jgi:hypothetical protein